MQYGEVKDIRMALDDNGHAKGYAFVEYGSPVRLLLVEKKSCSN